MTAKNSDIPEGLLVLLVDDDRTMRMLARQALALNGFQVIEAENGQQAIDRFKESEPDVILLDVDMPQLNGFEACIAIRTLPSGNDIPILMMTGMDDIDSINKSYDAGATDFISKPINWILLGYRVRYLIRSNLQGRDLLQHQEKLFAAQRLAKICWWELNLLTNTFTCSQESTHLFGLDPSKFDGSYESLLHWIYNEDQQSLLDALHTLSLSGGNFQTDHRFRHNDEICFAHHSIKTTQDSDGQIISLLGTLQDITKRKRDEDRICRLAFYDNLTGLPNRTLLLDRLSVAIQQAERKKQRCALIFLDIDNLKKINDTLGHSAGDQLLLEISKLLKDKIRKGDAAGSIKKTLSRFGGDEFVILLSEIRHPPDAAYVAERIIDSMKQSFSVMKQEIFMTLSIGIGVYPEDGTTPELLLKNADTAMYHAKSAGRNSFKFYTKSMNEESLKILVLENHLRRALPLREFFLNFQPKIDLQTGAIAGAEVLVRWKGPNGELIPPGKFIPLAEQNGLIVPIGKWIFTEACRQHLEWLQKGLPPIRLSINVSGRQFLEKDFIPFVAESIEETGIKPGYIDIEVTESFIMKNVEERIKNLSALKNIGISLSIDDFGTGYSSLNYLVRFPLDYLKVDRSFLVDIQKNRGHMTVTTAIISLAQNLNLRVIAEGVETVEQMDFLQKTKCDQVQGFLLSRPVSAGKMEQLLEASQKSLPLPWSQYFTASRT